MRYFALDVETANRSRGSICSIGIVEMAGGKAVNTWNLLFNPHQNFDPFNIRLHGITPHHVADAPSFAEKAGWLRMLLRNQFVISHSSFDESAIRNTAEFWNVPRPQCRWIDSYKIAKVVWPSLRDHKLKTVCESLEFRFEHHNALEDAIAVAVIVEAAREVTNDSVPFLHT